MEAQFPALLCGSCRNHLITDGTLVWCNNSRCEDSGEKYISPSVPLDSPRPKPVPAKPKKTTKKAVKK